MTRSRRTLVELVRPWAAMGLGAYGFFVQVTGQAPHYETAMFASVLLLLGGTAEMFLRISGRSSGK